MLVYGNRFADGLSREEVTDFFRKRCARILPLLATAAAIALFYNGTNSEFNAKTLLTGSALITSDITRRDRRRSIGIGGVCQDRTTDVRRIHWSS